MSVTVSRSRLVALFLALVVFAAACSSGSGGETAVATSDDAPTSSDSAAAPADDADDDESTPAPNAADSDEPSMAASSPIGAFFAGDGGFEAAISEYTTRVEEAITICMAEQGFEFKPTGQQQNEVQQRQNDLTVRQWTEEYGYGISTSFDSIAQQQANDPNSEILFSLSASEREVWLETLLGSGFDDPTAGDASELENQGCIGASIIETGGQGVIEGLEEFGEAYEEGEEVIYDTNEMIVAVGEWTRCMSETGFPDYSELDDPEAAIGDELDDITAPLDAALDELDPEEGRALIEGDVLDLESLPGLDVDALRALQDKEKKTALADLDCYEAHVRDVFEPLRNEFELGLMDTYGAELDALVNIGG